MYSGVASKNLPTKVLNNSSPPFLISHCRMNTKAQQITSAIHELIAQYQQSYNAPPSEINNGYCHAFAETIMDEVFQQEDVVVYPHETRIFSDADFLDIFEEGADEMADPKDYGSIAPDDFILEEHQLPCHYWLYHDGLHYDAECPNGVANFFDLPIMKRYCEKNKIIHSSITKS